MMQWIPNKQRIPQPLAGRLQWLGWQYEDEGGNRTDDQNGKKVPYDAKTRRRAKVNDPSTWSSFDEAVMAAKEHNFHGIGFVLCKDDPFFCVDADDCLFENGQIAPVISGIIKQLDSYTEITPSGRGIRVIGEGELPANIKIKGIELYDDRRYVTFTGALLEGASSTIRPVNGELEAVYKHVLSIKQRERERTQKLARIATPRIQEAAAESTNRYRAFCLAALEGERAKMLEAVDGTRHNRRYASAFALGGLLWTGEVTEEEIFDALAVNFGKDQRNAEQAIFDGIRAGAGQPREVPDRLLTTRAPISRTGTVDLETGEILGTDDVQTAPSVASSCPQLPESAQLPGELGHDASPWLDAYIDFSRTWSPRSYDGFHEACALWILSTVAARRVYVELGGARYSNLYIVLCARTSLFAKSEAAKIAMETIRAAGLTSLLAPDEATPQALIARMTTRVPADFGEWPRDKQEALAKRLAFAAQLGWFYDELGQKVSAMMRENGPMADYRGLLRRLDDCSERYESVTIGRGTDELERPYLALLGNLTPADLAPFAKKNGALWGDGFFARFGFVVPPLGASPGRGQFPRGQRILPPALVQTLAQWHQRLGVPNVTIKGIPDEGKRGTSTFRADITTVQARPLKLGEGVFEAFYRYHDALSMVAAANANADLDGSYTRLANKALRIAMLLASLEGSAAIEMRHWGRAQEITERWRASLHALIDQLNDTEGPSREAELEDKVMRAVGRLGPVTLAILRRDALKNVGTDELVRIFDALERHGRLAVERTRKGTNRYSLPTANVGK